MPAASPATEGVKCPHCGKRYKNKRSLREHTRHHCKRCTTTSPRTYTPSRCKHCGKVFHSANSLRVHASTQHPTEYARSPRSVREHRAPLKAKRQDSDRRVSSHQEAGRPRRREFSPAPEHKEPLKTSTDQLLQHLASSGGPRSRDIWETVLRRQLHKKSPGGRRANGGLDG